MKNQYKQSELGFPLEVVKDFPQKVDGRLELPRDLDKVVPLVVAVVMELGFNNVHLVDVVSPLRSVAIRVRSRRRKWSREILIAPIAELSIKS